MVVVMMLVLTPAVLASGSCRNVTILTQRDSLARLFKSVPLAGDRGSTAARGRGCAVIDERFVVGRCVIPW